VYTTIYVGWDMVHASAHQDEQVSHNAQVEKDSCHRSIFHGEQDAHKNHISVNAHCASCHVIVPLPIPAEGTLIAQTDLTIQNDPVPVPVAKEQLFGNLFSSRAPPRFV